MDGYYADNIDSCKGDFNIDGDIDGYDLLQINGFFGGNWPI